MWAAWVQTALQTELRNILIRESFNNLRCPIFSMRIRNVAILSKTVSPPNENNGTIHLSRKNGFPRFPICRRRVSKGQVLLRHCSEGVWPRAKGNSPGFLFVMSKILAEGSATQEVTLLTIADEDPTKRNWGVLLPGIIGGTLVALYSVTIPFIAPALRKHCLPFVPATSKQIENVLIMLKGRKGMLVDIGSGDGRIVIAAAKVGFKAVGYELNPWLVWYSRYRAWREGVHQDVNFYISDLWKISFSQYTNIVIFGVPQMMPQLEKKLGDELVQDARVIACRFPFPHWRPNHSFGEGVDTVWAYDSRSFRIEKEDDAALVKGIPPS